ncbi:MAG: AGE family epimerase/isomerase [Cyclobacteriaceae bacterium]
MSSPGKTCFFSLIVCVSFFIACQNKTKPEADPMEVLRVEIQDELENNVLANWYPRCIDSVYGGYLTNFDAQFEVLEAQNKMIVSQTRHVWTTATHFLNSNDSDYLDYATHGFRFLENFWDEEYGGYYQFTTQEGQPLDPEELKTAYGNSFAIYALSAYYEASKDEKSKELALATFNWLEKYSHDSVHGGYFSQMLRNGQAVMRSDTIASTSSLAYKDQNPTIHLLEAFTSLYLISKDELVKKRLQELYDILYDKIIGDKEYMSLYFHRDWTPVDFRHLSREEQERHMRLNHISFGHDIETTYLLLEAAVALGLDEKMAIDKARMLADNTLKFGWDELNGGIFDEGYYFDLDGAPEIVKNTKNWWEQAETLNTLLLLHDHYPNDGYDSLFSKQWDYIKNHIRDRTYGGWYSYGTDTHLGAKERMKGQAWKVAYHNYRGLVNCFNLLNKGKLGAAGTH